MLNGDCIRQVARWLSTPDIACLASTCRHFRHELRSMPCARFSYRRRRQLMARPRFASVAAWARSCPTADRVRRLSLCRVSGMAMYTVAEVTAVQATFRALHGLRVLHINMGRVPIEVLAVLPVGLRVLVVHRVLGFVALTGQNLGRLRELERVSIATTRGGITVHDMPAMPRLRDVRLRSDNYIDWCGAGCDRLGVLALHAPRVGLRAALCPVTCMSVSAMTLEFGPSGSVRSCHTGILSTGWAASLRHLRILVDMYFELENVPYKDMTSLQTLEFSSCSPVIPFELVLLPRLRRVAVSSGTLLVFEDRVLASGDDGYLDLPSRIGWEMTAVTPWRTRRCCQDPCWAPPAAGAG